MHPAPTRNRRSGFTLIEMICVLAIIAIMVALLLPGLSKVRERARQVNCSGQLRQVGVAFHAFAHDHNNLFPMQVPIQEGGTLEFARGASLAPGSAMFVFRHFQVLSNELGASRVLVCPSDTRLPAASFQRLGNQHLSFFAGLNSELRNPESLLAGDRNLTNDWMVAAPVLQLGPTNFLRWSGELHRFRGNLLFADGHVLQSSAAWHLPAIASRGAGQSYALNNPVVPAAPSPPSKGAIAQAASSPPGGRVAVPAAPVADKNQPTGAPNGLDPRLRSDAPVNRELQPLTLSSSAAERAAASVASAVGLSSQHKDTADPKTNLVAGTVAPSSSSPAGTTNQDSGTVREGFFAEALDVSLRFLWVYYIGLLLLAVLALYLRNRFSGVRDDRPAAPPDPN